MVIPRTYGRMGNFLFQVAAAAGYAWDHGLDYTVPTTTEDPKWNPIYLQHLAKHWDRNNPSVTVEEQQEFHYNPIPYRNDWQGKTIILDGYWQSELYFLHHRERILTEFGFQWSPKPGHVSVHVRRGDYLTIKRNGMLKHPPVTKYWLEGQMAKFPGARFVFFSDDIAWCKEVFADRQDCTFHQGTEVEDLVAMSWCEAHICSASTFSWWGAWLNRGKNVQVITPKHWLTPGWNNHHFTEEIIPKRWERA